MGVSATRQQRGYVYHCAAVGSGATCPMALAKENIKGRGMSRFHFFCLDEQSGVCSRRLYTYPSASSASHQCYELVMAGIRLPTTPKIYNVYFLAIISTVGGMLFGFDISSMSAIIGTTQYIDYFHNPAGVYQAAIGSALAAGSIVGCLIAGPISDRIGRRDACFFCKLMTY